MTSDLSGLQESLTEAVINAWMLKGVPDVIGGSCSEGRFEYFNVGNQYTGYQSLFVTYPDGTWQTGHNDDYDDSSAEPFDAKAEFKNIADSAAPDRPS